MDFTNYSHDHIFYRADQAPAGCPLSPPLQGSDASTLSVGLNTPC